MRIALVSPYSWTYPGGVTRHIEALALELLGKGHEVRVLAPFDADSRLASLAHRGVRPQVREQPEWLIPLGGTVGFPANNAISNLALNPSAAVTLRRELRSGGFDVIHIHEPVAPMVGWDALSMYRTAPLVGTFHTYNEKRWPHWTAAALGARRKFNHLTSRIAVSEAAAWTGRRYWGGQYRIIPNGVSLPASDSLSAETGTPGRAVGWNGSMTNDDGKQLKIVFVGQAVERKGLPVLLRAFEALREEVPATLTIVGVTDEEIDPLLLDSTGVVGLGRVCDGEKLAALHAADVLCAPSLRGESFGMVLTEAFAAGTPVVASNIAGYRDVVTANEDGLLVPPGDPTALAQALHDLANYPARVRQMGIAAGKAAEQYAWPAVADRIVDTYKEACDQPAPAGIVQRAGVRIGAVPVDLGPRRPPQRLPRLDGTEKAPAGKTWGRKLRVVAAVGLAGAGSYYGISQIGFDSITESVLASSPIWVVAALILMCSSMVLRALSWHAILRAALPKGVGRLADAFQGTSIGVLMSATLPARLGEVSRALVVARRLGRPREQLPVVLGTLVSQTLLNILALIILGTVMFVTVGLFAGRERALLWYSLAPIGLLLVVLLLPTLLRSSISANWKKAQHWHSRVTRGMSQVRLGLKVFRSPRYGISATVAQLSAWALQWLSCYLLLVALHLDERAGLTAAAAVLFAVNVSAILPVTPSNIGVFQAACVVVLTRAYGISATDALAYGIILQGVEIATAVIMGAPALVKEGVSWREVRLRALHGSPVSLSKTREAEI